jgi:hypothetical protein
MGPGDKGYLARRSKGYRIREFDAGHDFTQVVANVDAPFEADPPSLSYVIGNQVSDGQTSLSPCQTNVLVFSAVRVFEAIVARDYIEKVKGHDHLSCRDDFRFPGMSVPNERAGRRYSSRISL